MAIGNAFPNCPKFFLESGSFLLGRMITIFGTISFADLSTNISEPITFKSVFSESEHPIIMKSPLFAPISILSFGKISCFRTVWISQSRFPDAFFTALGPKRDSAARTIGITFNQNLFSSCKLGLICSNP